MYVNELLLYQFKNYGEREFVFSKPVVCISGRNGSGKTNLLDAIYFLCFTRSYLVHSDGYCVMDQKKGMRIRAVFNKEEPSVVQCILRENGKKEFSLDTQQYSLLSKHVGKFPAVFIAPDDIKLIMEGSEERRKYLDQLISQLDAKYLEHLLAYNKVLQLRNALLKQARDGSVVDTGMLEVYDEKLHHHAAYIFKKRTEFAFLVNERVQAIYKNLSDEREAVETLYQSHLQHHSLIELLQQNRHKDLVTQRSNYGIHKDDLVFSQAGMPLRQTASQGQRKSFLFGLKLAQFELLKEQGSKIPLLLLDDVFEKLDEERSSRLIAYVGKQDTQVFVTDTHIERLQKAFDGQSEGVQWINL